MKKLSWFLIIAGIIIVCIPIAGKLYNNYRQQALLKAAEDQINSINVDPERDFVSLGDVFSEETSQNDTENTALVDETTDEESSQSKPDKKQNKKNKQDILGKIKIEKIKVDAAVVEGVGKSNLSVGVGHIPGTAKIGQVGNCAIAGHRSYTFGKFFNRLNELEIEDEIILETKEGTFKYVVYDKLIVEPDDVSVLKGSKKHKVLTLITCEPIFIATHRLIIHAKLEE